MRGGSIFLAVNLVIVILSYLTGRKIVPGPDIVGVSLAFYSLFILPGMLVDLLVHRKPDFTVIRVAGIFAFGLLFASLIVLTGLIPGISYGSISTIGLFLLILMLLIDFYRRSRVDDLKESGDVIGRFKSGGGTVPGRAGRLLPIYILLFALCFTFFLGSGETGVESDSLDHISFIRRSLDGGELFPGDSFYRNGDGEGLDPRKGIWHPVTALWCFQSDTTPVYIWQVMPAFLAFFCLLFFWIFALEILRSGGLTLLALIFLLLFERGGGFEWLTKISYSRNVAAFLAWGAGAFFLRYLREKGRWNLVLLFCISIVGAAIHIVFILLIGVTAVSLLCYAYIADRRRYQGRFWAGVAVLVAALAVPAAFRLIPAMGDFNAIHTHRQGMMVLGGIFGILDPAQFILEFGPGIFYAIAVAPFIFYLSPDREKGILAGLLFLVPVVAVLNPLTAALLEKNLGYLHYRILYAAPAAPLLALAMAGLFRLLLIGRSPRSAGKSSFAGAAARRLTAAAAIAIFIMLPLRFAARDSMAAVSRIVRQDDAERAGMEDFFESLFEGIPRHAVIISDPGTSYMISAFSDKFVAVTLDQHGSPADPQAIERLKETRNLFSPAVPLSSSLGWLKKEGVEYIVLNTGPDRSTDFFGTVDFDDLEGVIKKLRSCSTFVEEIREVDGYILFRLEWSIPEREIDVRCSLPVTRQLVCGAGDPEESIPGLDTGCGIFLERFHLDRKILAPGDTLAGYFCWSAEPGFEFGLPAEWTVRMDTGFPRGSFYREWYGKQYRRSIERRNGEFYRYTVSGRVRSGDAYPDQWEDGSIVRQNFRIVLPEYLAEGRYDITVTVRRRAFLPNRRVADYFRNKDSFSAAPLGSVELRRRERVRSGDEDS